MIKMSDRNLSHEAAETSPSSELMNAIQPTGLIRSRPHTVIHLDEISRLLRDGIHQAHDIALNVHWKDLGKLMFL